MNSYIAHLINVIYSSLYPLRKAVLYFHWRKVNEASGRVYDVTLKIFSRDDTGTQICLQDCIFPPIFYYDPIHWQWLFLVYLWQKTKKCKHMLYWIYFFLLEVNLKQITKLGYKIVSWNYHFITFWKLSINEMNTGMVCYCIKLYDSMEEWKFVIHHGCSIYPNMIYDVTYQNCKVQIKLKTEWRK